MFFFHMLSTFVFRVSPDHGLLQQLKLSMSEIVSSFPPLIFNVSPWTIASPTDVLKKQLKRTLSMPSMGGKLYFDNCFYQDS